jgi:hypothetical protein
VAALLLLASAQAALVSEVHTRRP